MDLVPEIFPESREISRFYERGEKFVRYITPEEPAVRRRGRPRKYGRKVALKSLFAELDGFVTAQSPVYGERDVTMLMRVLDL